MVKNTTNPGRESRKEETRETEARTESWSPPTVLPDPDPQEGWVFRWVRTSLIGQADNTNVSKKLRSGWEPVKAEDHPEMMIQSDLDSRFGGEGNIEVGGLLLCKMPAEKLKARGNYHREKSDRQIDSIDNNYMRENDPRMPLLQSERSTKVDFGTGGK